MTIQDHIEVEMFDLVYFYYAALHNDEHRMLVDKRVSSDPKLQGKYHGASRMYCKATRTKHEPLMKRLHDRLLVEIKDQNDRIQRLRDKGYKF